MRKLLTLATFLCLWHKVKSDKWLENNHRMIIDRRPVTLLVLQKRRLEINRTDGELDCDQLLAVDIYHDDLKSAQFLSR